MELWVILLVVGGVIALAVLGTAFMPKLPSSSEEKEEMDLKAEEKRILKSGAVTSKRKWFAIQVGLCFPIANIVILLVLAFKKEKSNPTIRNWARANLILIILGLLVVIALALVSYFFFYDIVQTYLETLTTL